MQVPQKIWIFQPSILKSLQGYDRARLLKDVTAGITVGIVALPLAMAFAIASGLPPQNGIFTAIIAGFLISLFGGSKVQIGGPAGAFIVIVYGIVQKYGVANLLIATMMAGVFQYAMGLLRMGTLVRFIPVAVVIGFTNGIAVLIALSQLKDFFGLSIAKMPADFFGIMTALWQHITTVNPYAVAVAAGSLLTIILWQKLTPRIEDKPGAVRAQLNVIPGSIIALVVGSLAVNLLHLPVETIGTKFGGVPAALPSFTMPRIDLATLQSLVMPALTLALLGAIESLLCARVADGMVGDRHHPNQELMAQGTANFITPLFGGMPATGTIARTVTSIKSGATSPVAGMVHAASLLGIILIAAPLASAVPLATLAAVLIFVAWNMGEWRAFADLRAYRLPYRVTLLAVFFLTVVFDLTIAVQVGIFAACLTFIYRISSLTRSEEIDPSTPSAQGIRWSSADMRVWRIYGALFFGAVKLLEHIEDALPRRIVVIDLKNVIYMDTSGAEELQQLFTTCHKRGVEVVICGLMLQPHDMAQRAGLLKGDVRFEPDLRPGIAYAAARIAAG